MDINSIPPTAYVAAGTLLASLIAGIFSYLNMIVSKENKVSEFRLVWIDGLRNEVADFCSATSTLSFIFPEYQKHEDNFDSENIDEQLKWLSEISKHRATALDSITKIRLRLNYRDLEKDTQEKKLITAIDSAKNRLNNNQFGEIRDNIEEIRAAAAPILKSSWETVKKGERGYIRVRRSVEAALSIVLLLIITGSTYQYIHTSSENRIQTERVTKMIKSLQELRSNFENNNKKEAPQNQK